MACPVWLAVVELNDQFGFIDSRRKVVIPIKYTHASDFSEGLAAPGATF